MLNRERAVDYLNMLERLYIFDGFAGWEPEVPKVSLKCLDAAPVCCPVHAPVRLLHCARKVVPVWYLRNAECLHSTYTLA